VKIEEGIARAISTKSELFAAKITSCSRKDYFAKGLRSTGQRSCNAVTLTTFAFSDIVLVVGCCSINNFIKRKEVV